jgi:mannosyltransferase OCH1-like enzyme
MSNIPKVIHYCWFGGNPLSELALKCLESWKKYCPDYEIIEWNEKNFDLNCNSYVKEAYEAKKWAFITDYVRLFVLHEHGGIYMDTDVEVIKNIDRFLVHEAFSGFETTENIPTAIMGAKKGNGWIRFLLSYYNDKHFIQPDGSLDTTTNVVTITNMTKDRYNLILNNTFQEISDCAVFYPKDYFCPKDYDNGEITLTENTYCIHHFSGSWKTEKEKENNERKRRYIKRFGDRPGKKIYSLSLYLDVLRNKGIVYCIKKLREKVWR